MDTCWYTLTFRQQGNFVRLPFTWISFSTSTPTPIKLSSAVGAEFIVRKAGTVRKEIDPRRREALRAALEEVLFQEA